MPNHLKSKIYLTTNETEVLDKLLSIGWELLIFKAKVRKGLEKLFPDGVYGAGLVDSSGTVAGEIEDYQYGNTVQEAIEKAIETGKLKEDL